MSTNLEQTANEKQVKEEDKKRLKKDAKTNRSSVETKKEQKKKRKEEKRKKKIPRKRIFPIWLRIIVITLLSAGALIAGLMIGYGILGDGNPSEVLDQDLWQHIIDIIIKPE